jgi:antitoxin (DNA-binding transcriptional repressor) of toxin-antitoxin stability system
MPTVNIQDAKTHFSKLIARVKASEEICKSETLKGWSWR